MKFLHIADLHLGRRLGNISLLEDQRQILMEIAALAKGCDAVLIAGDVYNRAQPGSEALRLAGDFMSRLNAMGKPVYVVAGNHDGPEVVDYCGDVLRKTGIYAAGAFEGSLRRHVLRDAWGEIHIYLMPFIKPIHVRTALPEETPETFAEAVEAVLRRTELDPNVRNVLVAHQYVAGAEVCDSEERAIGGLDQVPAALFEGFDYVALGHLHSPQKLLGGRVRYSGSPLKYSLSEERQRKGALIVEMGEKGSLTVETVPLKSLRDLRTVRGPLAEIARPECFSEDFVAAVVTDELPPPDPMGALRIVYPNMISMRIENSRTNMEMPAPEAEAAERKDALAHFIDFYTQQNNQVPPDARRVRIMREIITAVEEGKHAAD